MRAFPPVVLATFPFANAGAIVLDHEARSIWWCGRQYPTARNATVAFKLLAALIVRQPEFVPMRELIAHAYADRADGGPLAADVCVRTILNVARRRLKAFGFAVIGFRHRGYRLECLGGRTREGAL